MDDARIEALIDELATRRAPGGSLCPSEVARALSPEDWRPLMSAVRTVALRMARDGRIRVTQGGRELDPTMEPHGPIRLRRP